MKDHFRVSGRLTVEAYEIAVGRWYALGMEGCEERALDDGAVDLSAYFTSIEAARSAAEDFPGSGASVEAVVNEDWNAQWRASMQPAWLAPGWWVSPLWLSPPLESGDRWIKIEPKMAFGTGHHETTRLAAQALIGLGDALYGASFLDIGTGSGVLCFVAAMSGAAKWLGVEIDPDCLGNLAENRALNSVAGGGSFVVGSTAALKRATYFDVIAMNMIHTESAPLLADCRALLVDNGTLLWSGILLCEKQRAVDAAAEQGFMLNRESFENEWWGGVFAKDR